MLDATTNKSLDIQYACVDRWLVIFDLPPRGEAIKFETLFLIIYDDEFVCDLHL